VISEVNDKSRLLANSLLLNYRQRQPVDGAASAYAKLTAANADATSAPLFYLSASPRQLQSSIQAFLDHNGFPRGVLITKRVTNDASSEPLTSQFAYKLGRLVEVFERLRHVSFVLIGDDGEQDPEIYAALQRRYPTRVTAIWIRRVHPDPARVRIEGQGDLAQLLMPIATAEDPAQLESTR
jgi:phosphatidate phosphatase APP1